MLKAQKTLKFIKADRNQGISKKDKPYDFASISLSDGLENFKLQLQPESTEFVNATVKRGDDVFVTIDVRNDSYDRTEFIVTNVALATVKA